MSDDEARPVTVFLLDDHEVVRRGLRELLEAGGIDVVGESASAQEATRRIPALRPDVAILDARLPDGSGLDTCRTVRSQDPHVKVLVLTSYDDEDSLGEAAVAGASGFLLKDIRGNRIVEAVGRIAAGENLLAPGRDGTPPPRVGAGGERDPRLRLLTPQERLILDHVADGLTNRQIGDRMHLAEKTVKNYLTSILAKLGLQRRTQAAVYALQHPPVERRVRTARGS